MWKLNGTTLTAGTDQSNSLKFKGKWNITKVGSTSNVCVMNMIGSVTSVQSFEDKGQLRVDVCTKISLRKKCLLLLTFQQVIKNCLPLEFRIHIRTGRLLENGNYPIYTLLFKTIHLLIFSKKTHLYVYSPLYFIHFFQVRYVSYLHMKQNMGF